MVWRLGDAIIVPRLVGILVWPMRWDLMESYEEAPESRAQEIEGFIQYPSWLDYTLFNTWTILSNYLEDSALNMIFCKALAELTFTHHVYMNIVLLSLVPFNRRIHVSQYICVAAKDIFYTNPKEPESRDAISSQSSSVRNLLHLINMNFNTQLYLCPHNIHANMT